MSIFEIAFHTEHFLSSVLLKQKRGNLWLSIPGVPIQIYVRWGGHRYFENKKLPTLEIANVSVEEEYRHKGVFTSVLKGFETFAAKRKLVVFIENIHTTFLLVWLLDKKGYKSVGGLPASVYLIL